MKNTKIVNIAIDISPTKDANAIRGVGFYTSRLVTAIQTEISENPEFSDFRLDLVETQSSSTYDLIHYPFFDPFKITLPSRHSVPVVVTVHDLIPRQFKKKYPVGLRGEINWQIQKIRLKQVSHIITDSEISKKTIAQLSGISTDNITTIYLAADPVFHPIADKKILSSISQKFHLPPKFVLYVGDINWNKNIPTLVRSCQNLGYPLVIVGSSATQKNVPIHPWTQDLRWLQQQKDDRLLLLGFVSDEDLSALFNKATLYCQPSFAEGFGLGLLEAMQAGCPTIYSRATSLSEISMNSGLSFDPFNSIELQSALKLLWNDPKLQQKLRILGQKRSAQFSWQKTAQATLLIYRALLR